MGVYRPFDGAINAAAVRLLKVDDDPGRSGFEHDLDRFSRDAARIARCHHGPPQLCRDGAEDVSLCRHMLACARRLHDKRSRIFCMRWTHQTGVDRQAQGHAHEREFQRHLPDSSRQEPNCCQVAYLF